MKKKDNLGKIFLDVDDEVLDRMPEWFKRLREAYVKKLSINQRE